MKTAGQIKKIKAALLYILKDFPEGIDYIKLFKILYFAQQEHLVRYGRPLVAESFYALKHGPVPSFSYKAFQSAEGKTESGKDFEDFLSGFGIKSEGERVYILSSVEPDREELSVSDMKCLDLSVMNYMAVDSFDLSELSHDTAWVEAYSRAQNDPEKNMMTLIDIARAGKASKGIINHIFQHQLIKKSLMS
jgi:uncharacterized phage-associated protein